MAAVRQVYAHQPLNEQLVQRLNPEAALEELAADIEEIGYPDKRAAEQGAKVDQIRD